MQLTALAAAINQLGRPMHGFSLCIYGPPKSGKTRLAATIAKVPQIKRVFMFDLENGHETLLTMLREGVLTTEQASKIQIIRVQDTPSAPIAMETILRCLLGRKAQKICEEHGKCDCVVCTKANKEFLTFNLAELGHDDVVIVDSDSALSASILNFYCRTDDPLVFKKPGWDEYGPQVRDLTNIHMVIQACRTNWIVVTHELVEDEVINVMKAGEIETLTVENKFPLAGTKNFSYNVAKYFSHVVYMGIEGQRHKGGSSSTYKSRVQTGSRGGWVLEKSPTLDLSSIFDRLYKQEDVPTAKITTA